MNFEPLTTYDSFENDKSSTNLSAFQVGATDIATPPRRKTLK